MLAFLASTMAFSFLNFLRGMETADVLRDRAERGCFLNFLRGMETAAGEARHLVPKHFLNFLRGMETRHRGELEV